MLEWDAAPTPSSAVTLIASDGDSDPSHFKVNQYCEVTCNFKGCDLSMSYCHQ